MKTTKKIGALRAARDLISDRRHWTTHVAASYREQATPKYCAYGAVWKAAGGDHALVAAVVEALYDHLPAWATVARASPALALARFNDARATSHVNVMVLFDRALSDLGRQQ